METLSEIEIACRENDHESVMEMLSLLNSDHERKDAFLRIIDYYENEESQFPVGYVIRFIEFLLRNGDSETAADYIVRLNRLNIYKKSVADLIYEYVIKPDEHYYKNKFTKNIKYLTEHNILFSDVTFDFEFIKREIYFITDYQIKDNQERYEDHAVYLVADVVSHEIIQELIEAFNRICFVYEDVRKFYYLLLFEDMSRISKCRDEGYNLFFIACGIEYLYNFFINMKFLNPGHFIDASKSGKYCAVAEKAKHDKTKKSMRYLTEILNYYAGKGLNYYRDLFMKPASDTRIMLITSKTTELNQHICRSWNNAFQELGYDTRLLIEDEDYETMLEIYLVEQMNDFKPDIVFHINFIIEDIFNDIEILSRNLLWIMRYRDKRTFKKRDRSGDASNIFISAVHKEWTDEIKGFGFPSEKIYCSPDGIDISIFSRSCSHERKYKYDLVSVNNAGGSDKFHLDIALGKCEGRTEAVEFVKALYTDVKEIAESEEFIFFYDSFHQIIIDRLNKMGIEANEHFLTYFAYFCVGLMMSFYRTKVIQWIVKSHITKNIGLWGKGWSNIEGFRAMHMGVARHGRELADIYGNSRISVSDHPVMSLHERNFEIFASGGFPLIKRIIPENNEQIESITDYFRESEEAVLFNDREDLLNKIQYYLDHPQEREGIAEKGRQVVLANFSNVAVAKKTMDFIKNYYAS